MLSYGNDVTIFKDRKEGTSTLHSLDDTQNEPSRELLPLASSYAGLKIFKGELEYSSSLLRKQKTKVKFNYLILLKNGSRKYKLTAKTIKAGQLR